MNFKIIFFLLFSLFFGAQQNSTDNSAVTVSITSLKDPSTGIGHIESKNNRAFAYYFGKPPVEER